VKCPDCERELVEVVDRPSRWCVECKHFISDDDMEHILDAFAKDDELMRELKREDET
jgi:hypothetical protein